MADGENLTVCPACTDDYQVEGKHVPLILTCFHTLCEGCIKGKLGEGSSFDCPQCGTKHSAENGIENIQENQYIIRHIKKMADGPQEKKDKTETWKKECLKHGKEQSLFCNEPGCQKPICLLCLKDDHKAHDFGDLWEVAEERCTAILDDVRSMKETLQKKKDDLLASKRIVAQNCQECTLEIIDMKAELIREIDRRAANLVFDITEHKKKADACINEEVAEIDEKFAIVNSIEKITNTKTIFEVETEKLENVKYAKKKIQSRFSGTTNYTVLTYKKSGERFKLLSPLCGKLMQKNKRIPFEITRNLGKHASQKVDNDKGCRMEEEIKGSDVSAETSTTNGNDTQLGSEEGHQTTVTASPAFEDISMDEDGSSDEKEPENVCSEMLRRVNGFIGKEGPKVSPERPTGSFPSMITSAPHAPTCINSFYQEETKDVIKFGPTISTTTGILSTNNSKTYTQLTDSIVRSNHRACMPNSLAQTTDNMVDKNTQPAETTVVKDKTAETTSVLSQPASNAMVNSQSAVNTAINNPTAENSAVWTQLVTNNSDKIKPSVMINQPAGNNTVFNKPELGTTKISQSAINAVVANNQSARKNTDFNQNITKTIQQTVNTTANKEAGGNTSVFNQPVVNTSETIPPAMNAVAKNQSVQKTVLKQLALDTSYNNRSAEGAMVNNQVIYNTETLGNILFYPQTTNAVPWKQSDEYIGVCGQSMKGKCVYSYPRSLYGDVNTSKLSSKAPQGSSVEVLGALTQPVNTYGLHTMGFSQSLLNTSSQGSAIGRQTQSHHSDVGVDSPARSNAHNMRSASSEDTRGRTTSERRLRDPRKYRSRLFGRKADVRGDAAPVKKRPRLESAPREDSRANYRVLKSISTGFGKLNVMDLLPDDTVAVSGKGTNKWRTGRPGTRSKFTKYDRTTGKIVCSSWSEYTRMPDGMAVFTSGTGDQYIAFSYGYRHAIDFYDQNEFRAAFHSYSVAPDTPGRLCTSLPGTLVYTDFKQGKQVVKWLDCNYCPPTPTDRKTNIRSRNNFLQDLCCVMHGEKELLVTTHSYGGIEAYLAGTDELEWRLGGRQLGMERGMNAVGITANAQGQLFFCDTSNNCVQMLSTDGIFLGTVLRRGEQGLGNPMRIRWCSKTRSLVIAHEKKGNFNLSFLRC